MEVFQENLELLRKQDELVSDAVQEIVSVQPVCT